MDKSPQLLKSGSDNFKSKLKNLFDTLAVFEKDVNLPTEIPEELEADSPEWKTRARRNRKTTRAMRGQESLFKKPGLPPLRRQNVPDFRRNPGGWKKYTLADVDPEDMTDASNTAAALSFLNSRKEILADEQDSSETGRVQFRKIVRNKPINSEPASTSNTGEFKQSKLVMPEYVVGEKKVKPKKTIERPTKRERELNLSHLHQFEEDE